MGPGTRKLFMLLILTLAVSTSLPGVRAYSFPAHSICKGWTEERTPVSAERYLPGDTAYLYFEIIWVGEFEFEEKWHKIPGPIISASQAVEEGPMKSFKIELSNPGGEVVNSFVRRKMEVPKFDPPGAYASAFLEILNVTSGTENGIWHLKWFDKADLVFDEQFMVGELTTKVATETTSMEIATETTESTIGPAPSIPSKPFFEEYASWVIIAVCAVAVVLLVITRRRVAKPVAAPPPPGLGPPAPTEVATPAAAKYCIQCGELIPEVAVYCPRCASRQE